jgi:hypothetical protein
LELLSRAWWLVGNEFRPSFPNQHRSGRFWDDDDIADGDLREIHAVEGGRKLLDKTNGLQRENVAQLYALVLAHFRVCC